MNRLLNGLLDFTTAGNEQLASSSQDQQCPSKRPGSPLASSAPDNLVGVRLKQKRRLGRELNLYAQRKLTVISTEPEVTTVRPLANDTS